MVNKVRLEITENRRRLHIGSYFSDLNETDYQDLIKIFSDQKTKELKEENERLKEENLNWEACNKHQKRYYDELEEKFLKCQDLYLESLSAQKVLHNALSESLEINEQLKSQSSKEGNRDIDYSFIEHRIRTEYDKYKNSNVDFIKSAYLKIIAVLKEKSIKEGITLPTDEEIYQIDFSHLPHMTTEGLVLLRFGAKTMRDLIQKQITK